MNQRSVKSVDIKLLHYCNFACTYCISGSQNRENDNLILNDDGSIKIYDGDTPFDSNYVDRLKYLRDNKLGHDREHFLDLGLLYEYIKMYFDTEWCLVFGGGEPLYYPKFEYFLDTLLDEGYKVIVLTNASLLHSNSPILNTQNKDNLLFRIGFHPEQRTNQSMLSKVNLLKEHGFKYVVNYILHPAHEKDDLWEKYLNYFIDNGIEYEITRFEGNYNEFNHYIGGPMTQFEQMVLEDTRYMVDRTIDHRSIGRDFFSIYGDGKVYPCNGYRDKSKEIGNVYDMSLNTQLRHYKSCTSHCELLGYQDFLFDKYLKS